MSVSTIDIIMGRISAARKSSPIAVFAAPDGSEPGLLEAVFGATTEAQRRMKTDPGFIGMFHKQTKNTFFGVLHKQKMTEAKLRRMLKDSSTLNGPMSACK